MPRPDIADGGSTPTPGRRSAVTRSGGVETTVHQERRRIYPAYRPSHPCTRPGIRRFGRLGLSFAPGAPSWRNWQTRRSQKPLSERTCGFESHTRHQGRTIFRSAAHLPRPHAVRRESAHRGPFHSPPRPDRPGTGACSRRASAWPSLRLNIRHLDASADADDQPSPPYVVGHWQRHRQDRRLPPPNRTRQQIRCGQEPPLLARKNQRTRPAPANRFSMSLASRPESAPPSCVVLRVRFHDPLTGHR